MRRTTNLKIILALLVMLMPFISFGQDAWTVETVPNTRLKGNSIHVSDPDNLLSDSCERKINEGLCSIRDKADVFLVVLNSIGKVSIEPFATDLFNAWGIGDAAAENGVLMLLVMDKHKFRIEVGYGVENVLTDLKCRDITENHIIPFFKEGDYEGGLLTGVAEILSAFEGIVPDGFAPSHPTKPKRTIGDILALIALGIILLLILWKPIVYVVTLIYLPIQLLFDMIFKKSPKQSSSSSSHPSSPKDHNYSHDSNYDSSSYDNDYDSSSYDDDYGSSYDDSDDDSYSSSSSSDGSFGGGSSGGGGYTGSW